MQAAEEARPGAGEEGAAGGEGSDASYVGSAVGSIAGYATAGVRWFRPLACTTPRDVPQLRPLRGERDAGCPERPDGYASEGAEGGAGGTRSAQDRQQGVAAPEAARRDRARASGSEREP